MSTPRTPMSTPRCVLSCLTSTCPSSSHLSTQIPLYSSPFSIVPQVRYVYDQDSTVPPRRLCLRSRQSFYDRDAYIYAQDHYIYPEGIMSTSLYLQPRGFREIRLPCFHSLSLRLTLAVSTLAPFRYSLRSSVIGAAPAILRVS